MIAKTINYINYDGEQDSEKAYFDMTDTEMTKFILKYGKNETSLKNYIKKVAEENNTTAFFELVENLLLSAYGTKSEDGRRFIKDRKKAEEFSTSEPYSVLFTELFENPDNFIDFIIGLQPNNKKIDKEAIKKAIEEESKALTESN